MKRSGQRPHAAPAGHDLRLTVTPQTALRYGAAIRNLEAWLLLVELPVLALLVKDTATLSAVVVAYLQWAYDAGHPHSHGSYVIAGLQFRWPALRTHMKPAWAVQRRWAQLLPPMVRTPMPWTVLLAMCSTAVVWGWPSFALLLLLGFHCMLRPGEIAALRRGHLRLTSDSYSKNVGVVALTTSKTATRAARIQSVTITDVWLLQRLDRHFGTWPEKAPLCSGGTTAFTRRFMACLQSLRLAGRFTPGGLRGGGAVAHFEEHANLGALQFRGRWENPRSMLHYLQLGLAASSFLSIPAAARSRIEALAGLAVTLVEGAPPSSRIPLACAIFETPSEASVSDVGELESADFGDQL